MRVHGHAVPDRHTHASPVLGSGSDSCKDKGITKDDQMNEFGEEINGFSEFSRQER